MRIEERASAIVTCLCIGICCVHALSYPTHLFTDKCKECESNSEILVKDYAVVKGLDVIWNEVKGNMTCCLTIRPHEQEHLAMRVRRFHIDFTFSNMKVIDLSNNQSILTERYLYENGSTKAVKDVQSSSGFRFEWIVKTPSPSIFMDLMFTSFVSRSDQENKQCPEFFYISCDSHSNSSFDDRCIKEVLQCDLENNCGNNIDENRCHEMPIILMFIMLTCLTLALFATGFRISQVIARRSAASDDGSGGSDWRNSLAVEVGKGGHEQEDAHPLLHQQGDDRQEQY